MEGFQPRSFDCTVGTIEQHADEFLAIALTASEPQSKTCADIHDAWWFVNEQCGLLGIPLPTPSPTASH